MKEFVEMIEQKLDLFLVSWHIQFEQGIKTYNF